VASGVVANSELRERSEVFPPLPSVLLPFPSFPSSLFPYAPLPSPPSFTLPSCPSSLPSLRVGPLNQARGSGELCKLPSGIWGGAPAEIEFGAF